jgi:nucleoside-diphosphate-sugar epimerase
MFIDIHAHAYRRPVPSVVQFCSVEELIARYDQVGLRFMSNHMCFDILKAREQLGYYPEYTTEEAIEETAIRASNNPERSANG